MKKVHFLECIQWGKGKNLRWTLILVFFLSFYSNSIPDNCTMGRSWIQHPFSRDHQGIFGKIAHTVGSGSAPSSLGSSLVSFFIHTFQVRWVAKSQDDYSPVLWESQMEIRLFNWYLTTDKIKALIIYIFMLKDVHPNTGKRSQSSWQFFMIQQATVHPQDIHCWLTVKSWPWMLTRGPPNALSISFPQHGRGRKYSGNSWRLRKGQGHHLPITVMGKTDPA